MAIIGCKMRNGRAISAIWILTLGLVLGLQPRSVPGKTPSQVNWQAGQGVDSAAIALEGKNLRIAWPQLQNQGQGLCLIFYSPNPQFNPSRATLLGATQRNFYVDPLSFARAPKIFYQVLAFPQGLGIITDEVMLEDFEDGLVTLSSYPGEDHDPNDWEVTALSTYDSSLFSLMLYGNTWKVETISPQVISAGTVWRAAVAAAQTGEIQAFGVGNGTQEYFYIFEGNTLPTGSHWNSTYHSVANIGSWALIQLPIGRDWMNEYGSLPIINRLFYVNDIDAPTGNSVSFFDEIHDITDDLPNIPQVIITAQGDSSLLQPYYQFTSLVLDPDSPTHTYFWDFGDSTFSDQPNPSHTYSSRAYRTVGLTVQDPDSLFGYAAKHLLPPPGTPNPEFTLNAAGDVMMARRYADPGGILPTYGVNYIFQRIISIFSEAADLNMINLETSLTDEGYPHPTKEVVYRSAPYTVNGLTFAGIDYAALGNNHTMDYMEPGMAETFRVLDTTRIQFSGSGFDDYWATHPAFLTVHGIRVGVLSYCNRDGREDFLPPFLEAGYNKFGFAMFDEATLDATIPALDSLCDLIVVQVHAGTEYDISPMMLASLPPQASSMPKDEFIHYDEIASDSSDRILKQHAIDLGADLVLCHHPHVIQAFEVYQGKLIVHSFGNFAFDQTYWETYLSMILYSRARLSGFDNFTFRPVYIDDYVPTPASGELAEAILRKMAAYSEIMNTDVSFDSAAGIGKIALSSSQVSESNRDIIQTVNFAQEGSYWISAPLRIEDPGFLSAIVSVAGIPGGSQLRLARGREILFMGGFEYEGGWLWSDTSPDVYLESMYPHGGTFCLGVRRTPGQYALWGELEDRIPTNENIRYSVDGFISGTNANNAALSVAFYWARTAAGYINEQMTTPADGSFGWTRVYKNLITPADGIFANVRCRNEAPASGTSTARFDDLKLIEWTNTWTTISTGFTSLSYPTEHTFIQLRCNQAVASATVTYRMTTRTIQ